MAVFEINLAITFFLVLAIVYGALEVSRVFGNKGVRAIIAVVIALFSITSPMVVEFVGIILPYAALFFIVFFFAGFVVSFFKDRQGDFGLLMVILALVLVFLASGVGLDIVNFGDQNFIGMVALLVIALILYGGYKMKAS